MKSTDYFNLAAFVAIVETGSFRKAAARMEMQPSTLSHAMRTLEKRMGVSLLHRTTRHVSPTEAGQALYAQVAPAFADIAMAVEHINPFRQHPAGTVRLSVPRMAAAHVLAPRFREFAERYPDVTLEISANNGLMPGCAWVSTYRKTWWPYALRRIFATPWSARPNISSASAYPKRPTI